MPEAVAAQLVVTCPACGTANRISREKLDHGSEARCGRCKQPLSVIPKPIIVSDGNFAELVERSPLPVLVDLWAPWCGPCRMIGPVVEELAAEFAGRVRVAKINVDENPVTSGRFGIQSIPALLIFNKGVEIDRLLGAQPKTELVRHLQRALA